MHVAAVYRCIYVLSVLGARWIYAHALYALLSIYVLHFYMAMSLPSAVLFPWCAQTVQCCCGSWWRWAWSWGGATLPTTWWSWWRGVWPRTTSPSTTTARRGGTSGSSRASSRRGRWRSAILQAAWASCSSSAATPSRSTPAPSIPCRSIFQSVGCFRLIGSFQHYHDLWFSSLVKVCTWWGQLTSSTKITSIESTTIVELTSSSSWLVKCRKWLVPIG